jgi:hypothetical protein
MDKTKITVLRRKGGTWQHSDITKLRNELVVKIAENKQYPEHVILQGHHEQEAISRAINDGAPYNITHVVGDDDSQLPFVPKFG